MRIYAVLALLLLAAAGCPTGSGDELRKVGSEIRAHEGDTSASDRDVRDAEEQMEPESDPDDR